MEVVRIELTALYVQDKAAPQRYPQNVSVLPTTPRVKHNNRYFIYVSPTRQESNLRYSPSSGCRDRTYLSQVNSLPRSPDTLTQNVDSFTSATRALCLGRCVVFFHGLNILALVFQRACLSADLSTKTRPQHNVEGDRGDLNSH